MSRGGLLVCSFLLLVCAATVADAPQASADWVVATVAVGSTPQQVQLSPDGSKLFVSNEGSSTVSVISTASDSVLALIPVGTNPGPIRFTPNGAKAYVVNEDTDNVSVINVATHTVTQTVPVGDRPVTLSATDDGTKVYVANEISDNVSVISTGTDTVIGTIPVGTAPHVLAKTPDGSKLYVANEGAASNSVSVISTASDSVVATISLLPSQDPGSIHFLPDGSRAYVANRGCLAPATACPGISDSVAPTVSVINVATNIVVTTINPVGQPGDAPHAMRITPDGSKLYLVEKHRDEVIVIDTATNLIRTGIRLQRGSCFDIAFGVGSCPVRIELTADGSRAYVVEQRPLASNGVLTAICTGVVPAVCGGVSTDTVVATTTLGGSPVDLEITACGKAYMSNSASSTVSVVRVSQPKDPNCDTDGDTVPNGSDLDDDGDGCPDTSELSSDPGQGGLRDPHNPWDYFNPTKDGQNRVGDILLVVGQYFQDALLPGGGPNPNYTTQTDRTDDPAYGPDQPWRLLGPNGQQRVDDIIASVNQYFHDCA